MLGAFGSSVVFAASAVAEKYKYPYISGAASANPIFERGFKYVFATLNKTFDEVEAAARVFSLAQPKPTKAAVIGADHLFGKLSAEGFKKFLGEMGIEVVHFEIFPVDLTDYNSIMLKVKRQSPDLVFVGGLFVNALRAMKAAKEVDFTPKGFAFSYGPTVPEFVKEFGKDAEGVIAASEWLPSFPFKDPVFGSAQGFADAIQQKYGHAAAYVQAAAAAGLVAQQTAVETLGLAPPLGDKEREAVMEQLHRQDIQTLYGRVKFGADGGIVQKPPIAVQNQGGKFVMVYPADLRGVHHHELATLVLHGDRWLLHDAAVGAELHAAVQRLDVLAVELLHHRLALLVTERRREPERLDGRLLGDHTGRPGRLHVVGGDRKSTRLNSSHSQISYAVFCLKKKKNQTPHRPQQRQTESLDPT